MSVVICSGVQKAGTHLLYKVVDLLGVPNHPKQYTVNAGGEMRRYDEAWLKDGTYSIHRHLPVNGKHFITRFAPDAKFVVILRDPRNVFVSRMRRYQRLKKYSTDTFEALSVEFLRPQKEGGKPIVDPKRQLYWVGWLEDSGACVVRFEDLRGCKENSIKVLLKIRDYLTTTVNPETIYKKIEGGTGTWSGLNSQWTQYWTKAVDKQFRKAGGYDACKVLGYH